MREQAITRVVDVRASQGRVVLWLACGHKLTCLSPVQFDPGAIKAGDTTFCKFCDDPTPEERAAVKTPQQLYREAGEP